MAVVFAISLRNRLGKKDAVPIKNVSGGLETYVSIWLASSLRWFTNFLQSSLNRPTILARSL